MATPTLSVDSLCTATMHDRAVGTLIGSAIGDAVGLYTEFLTAEKSIREYPSRTFSLLPNATPFARDMHRLKHNPGEWTDDTDHALLILLSFMHSNQLDPKDVASRLRTWVEMGLRARDSLPLGLGATVGAIVRNPKYLEDPVGTAHAHWVKFGHNAAANGSLMRTHPLGVICVHRSWDETFEIAARFSAITHVDPRCVTACMVGTALIRGLITGEVRNEQHVDELINAAINDFNNRITPMFRKEGPFTDADPGLDIEEFKKHTDAADLDQLELDKSGIGYVLKALGSGVYLLRAAMCMVKGTTENTIGTTSENSPGSGSVTPTGPPSTTRVTPLEARTTAFEPLITRLIMHGGDADTNACFGGAVLGAYLGYTSLPSGWRGGLRHSQWLMEKAESVAVLLKLSEGTYDGKQDKDTYLDGGRGYLTPDQMERRFMELQARMAAEAHQFIQAEEAAAKRRNKEENPGMLDRLGRKWGV